MTEYKLIRRVGRIFFLVGSLSALLLITILFFGYSIGALIEILSSIAGPVIGRIIAFLLAGAMLGLMQAPLAILAFGSRLGPAASFLCGIPLAIISIPSVDGIDSLRYVLLGCVSALSCTVLASTVVLFVGRRILVRDFVLFLD